jgi:formylglycine-generating enzyme required for sulfatase activity
MRAACLLLSISCWLGAAAAGHAAVEIEWVEVGQPGNACDLQPQGCFGAVGGRYRIAKLPVTNAQYAEFLTAVATTADPLQGADPNALYSEEMDTSPHGGITRSGDGMLGDYAYALKPGMGEKPVVFVSFWDSIRFSNWLHNGQPSGVQDATTTEDGAYTITAQGVSNNTIARNAGASVFVPSEDEWYKAAYYDPATQGWFDYPAGSDAQTVCSSPTSTPNSANCESAHGTVSDVGAYTGSPGPSGTLDQGGNVWERHDTILGDMRTARGGSWLNDDLSLAASIRGAGTPGSEFPNVGLRLAPEPPRLVALGATLALLAGLARGAADRRRA